MTDAPARPRRAAVAALALLATFASLAAVAPATAPASAGHRAVGSALDSAAGEEAVGRVVRKPNIIFFLADDMATPLLEHMPRTRRLIFAAGARFTNFHTNIGLCCPARASLLTGKYAHNTGIVGNAYPDGFHGFMKGDERRRTVAVALKRDAGYRTGLLGKYFNEYPFVDTRPRHGVRPTYVPNGWSDWAVPIRGQYRGTDYDLNLNGRIVHKEGPRDYLGDFLIRRALRQIGENRDGRGLALFLSFYGPHAPEPTSPVELRNDALRQRVSRIDAPRTPDFNERDVSDKPRHIRTLSRIGPRALRIIDRTYRRQVLSVTSIDRYVAMVVRKLRQTRQLRDTYLVFSSDHGYHLGAHRLRSGKNMAYASDVHVPFAIRGPGIEPGTSVHEVTGNIDVAPTFAEMAGLRLRHPHDGESLLTLARGGTPAAWRNYFYVARGLPFSGDADGPTTEFTRRMERLSAAENPPYRAVISGRWQYIRHGTGEEELYDRRLDPYQVRNVLARPPENRTEEEQQAHDDLRRALSELRGCFGVAACRVQ